MDTQIPGEHYHHNHSEMDSHDSESSNRAPTAPSSKKKGAKKRAQAKKPAQKSQRSEIPVLRVIDGNAAPSPPPPNGAGSNTEPTSHTASKREQKAVFEDTGNDENAGSPIRTRVSQLKRTNGNSNSDALDTGRSSAGNEVTDTSSKTSTKPASSSSHFVPNEIPQSDTPANDLEKEQNKEEEPETYVEALKEGLKDNDNGIDEQKCGQDQVVVGQPKTNGLSALGNHTAADGPRQRHVKIEKSKEEEEADYPFLPIPGSTHEEGGAYEEIRLDSYDAGGARFAPWNIPLKRRLQTLAVMVHCLSIASTASFFFFLCAIPLTWPILVPYLLHILLSKTAVDGKLRLRSERFRRLPVWKHFAAYFPAKLHKTHDLPPTRKYIFGYHPHGIISHGAFSAFATEALGFSEKFPGITNTLLTLDSNFRIPIYREYILSLGLRSVSKESILNTLTRGGPNNEGMGRAVTIVIGGARESLEAQPGTMHLVLGERKGFIKLAIRTGADLVPVLAFGENDLYDQVSPKTHPNLRKVQMYFLRTLKFTLPFLHGRGIFNYDVGLMPYRRPLNIVVGKPIKVAMARDGIDSAEVERLHGLYVRELEMMWDRYKDQFAGRRMEEMQILK